MITIIHHHAGDDAYDAGWYIISLDTDGTAFDAIGPFDSEAEAQRTIEETATE
ncbi:hypothetical protein ACTG4Q_21225 [Bradyrhizobium denitrificans]